MNVERLYLVLQKTHDAVAASKIIEIFARLKAALQAQVNEPATASHQQQVSAELTTLRAVLTKLETNNFSPGWKQILYEHKLWYFLGSDLLEVIEQALANNTITPSLALKEIGDAEAILVADFKAASRVLDAFKRFDFDMEKLLPGEAEVGVLIPRGSIDSELTRFSRELTDTAKIIGVFEELTTSARREPKIRNLSSSDLTVLLDIWPISGAALAAAVERIAAFYKQALEIKKLKIEMARLGVPKNISQQLDKDANDKMEANLKLLRDEIIRQYKGEKARKHELDTELLIALHKIANKIDNGIYFEFRAGEPEPSESPENEDAVQKALREHTAFINAVGRRMAFFESVEGRILQLPENGKPDAESGTSARKKD